MITGRLADFQLGRRLGAGSFGEVHEAFDRQRQMRVALKRLLITHPEALYRFKKEFRSLAGIFHPNLVALHELFTEGEGWYIAMELVHGVDIVRYARRDALVAFAPTIETMLDDDLEPTLDERIPTGVDHERLRGALFQLAQGVEALHDAGRVHRDLKPSNVLVNGEGVVKVLDFGLTTELRGHASGSLFAFVGTPEYMAPEQARGEEVAPAADWYAVGSLLYEALTARAPFEGDVRDVLAAKQVSDAADPRALRPGLPDDLCDLCMRLLERDPARRPSGRELVERVDARRISSPRPPRSSAPPMLVGREAQLRVLAEAFDECRAGATSIVHVSGPSGIGKSSLVTTFLSRPEACGSAVVLHGRCCEGDAVPFKAVDTIVDALTARLLRARPEEAAQILPKDFAALTRLFPALRRLDSRPHGASLGLQSEDPFEIRRRGFSAMREMLGRLGSLHPLVVWIDDLHWADGDSVAFLRDLIHPPDPPSLLLILSYRSEEEQTNDVLRALQHHATSAERLRQIRLAPLEQRDAATLATALLSSTGTPAEADVEAIARESRGDPLFVHELARHVMSGRSSDDVTVDDLIAERVTRLDETGRSVLAVIALAATALDVALLREVVGLSGEVLLAVIGALKAEHLVRVRRVGDGEAVETYHDRIRERARALLEPTVARAWHARLADALERVQGADPEALAVHHRAAGNRERAGWHFERAAADALKALAFERAARLYKSALKFDGHTPAKRRMLNEQLGSALANAGRGVHAARAFELAAAGAGAEESFDLRRQAADQLLRSGHFDRGVEASRVVLAGVGLRIPVTRRFGPIVLLLYYRAFLLLRGLGFRERARTEIPPEELRRIDAWWSVGSALGQIDPVLGHVFATRALLLALSAGDLERIVRSVGWEVGFAALRGGRATRRTEEVMRYARELADLCGTLPAGIFATTGSGAGLFLCGRFREAADQLAAAHRMLEDGSTGLVHERVTARTFLINALAALGQWKEMRRLQQEGLRDARARGDVYAAVSLRTGSSNLAWLVDDRPDLADAEARAAVLQWSKSGFHNMHFYGLMARIRAQLYLDNAAAAYALAIELHRETRRSLLWRIQFLRIYALHLRAASALAMVARGFGAREKLLREAARDARALGRERMPWSDAIATAIRASIALQKGAAAEAIDALHDAATEFDAAEMHGYAEATRHRAAHLRNDALSATEITRAKEFFQREGVVNPEKMIAMLLPGLDPGLDSGGEPCS